MRQPSPICQVTPTATRQFQAPTPPSGIWYKICPDLTCDAYAAPAGCILDGTPMPFTYTVWFTPTTADTERCTVLVDYTYDVGGTYVPYGAVYCTGVGYAPGPARIPTMRAHP